MNQDNIVKLQSEVENIINTNKNYFEEIQPIFQKDAELNMFFDEMYKSFKESKQVIDAEIENNWNNDEKNEERRRMRHDLYGEFTKINFTIELILSSFASKIVPELQEKLQSLLKNNKHLYEILKTIFQYQNDKK